MTSLESFLPNSVEVNFKDQYISRRDMWLFIQELDGQAIYRNQILETT